MPRSVVVGLWEKLFFRNLKSLMRGSAFGTEKNLDWILLTNPGVTNWHQIITHGMRAEVEDRR